MTDISIAISSFRSNESVLSLLDAIFSTEQPLFLEIIVIDSEPTGLIEQFILKNNYPVNYIKSQHNLGSAGNLALRLNTAAKNPKANWCLCLNHDAYYTEEFAKSFIDSVRMLKGNVGAIFPTRWYNNGEKNTTENLRSVLWNSSNGCIYSLAPTRLSIEVDTSLWMGWEDYLYCMKLLQYGYQNYLVNSLPFYDSYEYKSINFLGTHIKLNDKPSWYDYYSIRNLIYIGKHIPVDQTYLKLLSKVCVNSTVLAFFKDKTLERHSYFIKGLFDGFTNKMGFKDII